MQVILQKYPGLKASCLGNTIDSFLFSLIFSHYLSIHPAICSSLAGK